MSLNLNQITQGDSFQLIKEIPDQSINLLLTDPPYFLDKSVDIKEDSGYEQADWDDIKKIPEKYGNLSEILSRNDLTNAEKQIAEDRAQQRYFEDLISLLEPKMALGSVMVIFNRLTNINTMRDWLEINATYGSEIAKGRPYRSKNEVPPERAKWVTSGTFEWVKTNPSPNISEEHKSEYALVAINSMGLKSKQGANLPEYYVSNRVIDNAFLTAHVSSKDRSKLFGEATGHVTPKPFQLWEYLIRRFSQQGDLILDPFSGSGTTALVATDLGREFYAIEYDEEQFKRSSERLERFKKQHFFSVFI